ncbi:MAG TPA: YihY/virulence factor BrkB family protein [Planctomycetaceae bacterium]|nr:YihY/virulence factor BrkB family protein [Planctomycetaceae bacterium]
MSATLQLWGLGGLSWWDLLRKTWRSYRENHFDARSAQFAYYSLLALFPFLILLLAILARLPLRGVLESSLDAANHGLPDTVAELLDRQVADIQAHSTVSLIAGSLFLLTLAGSQVFLTIKDGLNTAYGVRETRRFWQVYGLAFLLTVAASLLFLVALVLMVVGPLLSEWIAAREFDIGWLTLLLQRGVRWVVVCAALWIYTSTIYWLGPSVKLRWCWLSPGSVVATVGWVAVTQGFRLYVENLGRYNETYGTLGGVIVLIVWLDLTGAVLFLGGQTNAVIHRAAGERAANAAPAQR